MSLLYPLGLLGLIGVPILIIIYIIKNKYTEQTVTSTYIWTLSEKFLKRRNPINKLQKWISLLLQILMVVLISLAIAHPTIILPGKANDYCFILDASGSMTAQTEGVSRFDRAKSNVEGIITQSQKGSTYTLICAGETSAVIYRNVTDKDQALKLLSEVEISGAQADFDTSLENAQEYFDETPSSKIYFLTDSEYASSDNVEIVNVSASEVNYAIVSAESEIQSSGLLVKGKVIAYGGDGNLTISVYVDGASTPTGQTTISVAKVADKVNVSLNADELAKIVNDGGSEFSVQCASVSNYQSIRVVIDNADAISTDNEIVLYNIKQDTSFNTLIVSDSPFFLKSMFNALGHRQIDVMATDSYDAVATNGLNYGLYIFDSFTPQQMPTSGAVWFFSPTTVNNSGFAYQTDSGEYSTKILGYSTSSKSETKKLLKGIDTSVEMYISKYSRYSQSADFLTVLTCEGNPAVFAGSNGYGNREVVFAFSLNHSDMPLTFNCLQLFENLLNYTFPQVIDEANYFCGDIVNINVISGTQSLMIVTPSGEEEYLSTESAECSYTLAEVGLYTLKVRTGSGNSTSERTLHFYSEMPYSESVTIAQADSFSIVGDAVNAGRDGIYDDLLALFIILAVIFIADWMVYCYEQYQLR